MDLAHRIGQTKQLYIFRFITENSTNECMLELYYAVVDKYDGTITKGPSKLKMGHIRNIPIMSPEDEQRKRKALDVTGPLWQAKNAEYASLKTRAEVSLIVFSLYQNGN